MLGRCRPPRRSSAADAVVLVTDHDAFDLNRLAGAGRLLPRHPRAVERSDRGAALGGRPRHRRSRLHRFPRLPRAARRRPGRASGRARRPLDGPRLEPLGCQTSSSSKAAFSTTELVTGWWPASDAVVHLAAVPAVARSLQDPRASHDANATGTLVVLEAARATGAPVVVASSSSVYGQGGRHAHPRRPSDPPGQPVRREQAGDRVLRDGLRALVRLARPCVRFFNVFGPSQRADHAYAAVIPAFVSAAQSDSPSPSTATGPRPATSPTSVTSPPSSATHWRGR